MHFAAQLCKRGPHQGAYLPGAESAHLPVKQRARAAKQVESRPRQAEWLQVVDATILKNAKTHGSISYYATCKYFHRPFALDDGLANQFLLTENREGECHHDFDETLEFTDASD
jgi:hypothetical protein